MVIAAAAVALPVAGWLALRHVPGWYRPLTVPDDQFQRVRNSLTDRFSDISDQMVTRSVFEVSITDQEVTEWLVARGQIWPEADRWLPPWLTHPVVAFLPGRVVLGARVDYHGWRTIAGAHFTVAPNNGGLLLRLTGLTAGALPLPVGTLAEPLEGLVESNRLDPDSLPDEFARAVTKLREGGALALLTDGQRLDGPFVWKNGDRPYRIRGVEIGQGWLKVRIEPL